MTLDQIDQMVRQANPVPDLTVLEPVDASVLVFDQQRRMEMQTHDRVEVEQEQEKSRRGFLVGIAAAAVIVIGVLVLIRPIDTPVAATPVEVATAFVEAYASFDIDEAFSYLAADAVGVDTLAEERLLARFLEAIGTRNISTGPCEEVSTTPDGTLVRCPYEYHMLRSDEIGLGPYGPNAYNLTVLDGGIVSLDLTGNSLTDGFSDQMWMPFALWVKETYPDDVAIMYEDASQRGWRITEESIPVWGQRSREYVAAELAKPPPVEIASAFLEAYRRSFDMDQALSYVASSADLPGRSETKERAVARWLQAIGWTQMLGPCEEVSTAPSGTQVSCSYEYHSLGSDEIGLGPFGGNRFDVTVLAGKVVSVSEVDAYMSNGYSEQMWEPFSLWLEETHPEDGPIMYENWPDIRMPAFTGESIQLWEQRTQEYVGEVGG